MLLRLRNIRRRSPRCSCMKTLDGCKKLRRLLAEWRFQRKSENDHTKLNLVFGAPVFGQRWRRKRLSAKATISATSMPISVSYLEDDLAQVGVVACSRKHAAHGTHAKNTVLNGFRLLAPILNKNHSKYKKKKQKLSEPSPSFHV